MKIGQNPAFYPPGEDADVEEEYQAAMRDFPVK